MKTLRKQATVVVIVLMWICVGKIAQAASVSTPASEVQTTPLKIHGEQRDS